MRTLFAIALLCLATPAFAQDELFVPKPKQSEEEPAPKPKPSKPEPKVTSISGLWGYEARCSTGTYIGTFNIKPGSGGSLSGTYRAITSDIDGTLAGAQQGSDVRLDVTYVDVLGSTVIERYASTLNTGHSVFSGKITGGWGSGCKFTASRQ